MRKTVIMVPTYNEKANIGRLIEAIRGLRVAGNDLHVLVVDDNSPDGTWRIVQEYAAKDSNVSLMLRTTGRGRGSAGLAGFKEAIRQGADYVIEMDADFSHDPKYIPELIAAAEKGADLVLGSRFVAGGADEDRGLYRQLVTKAAGQYVRLLLNVKVRDVSSGYRCFRRQTLEDIGLDSIISTGPSIVLEILFKCILKGKKAAEVPIVFIDRREGETKLNFMTLLKTLGMVAKLRFLKERGHLFTI